MVGFYNYTVILTYLSLVSSVVGMTLAMGGGIDAALGCLLFSGLCDCFDGKIARTMQRTEEEKRFGIQIDSLCDVVSFGVFPAVIGYAIGLRHPLQVAILALYVLAGVIRLAYFNVTEETRQSQTDHARKSYVGLPITASSLLTPLVFLLERFFSPAAFPWFFTAFLAALGVSFIAPLRVAKPHGKGIYALLGAGGVIFLCVLLLR